MSEFQNKAVELLKSTFGEQSLLDKNERRSHFLREALELFRAMGGSVDVIRAHTISVYSKPAGDVVEEIGDVMNSLAGVALSHDVDVVQVAYNRLDDGLKEIGAMPAKRLKRGF